MLGEFADQLSSRISVGALRSVWQGLAPMEAGRGSLSAPPLQKGMRKVSVCVVGWRLLVLPVEESYDCVEARASVAVCPEAVAGWTLR